MFSKAWLGAAFALALSGAAVAPVAAQSEADLFFGIAGELIRQSVQNDQANKQRAFELQQQQAAAAAERAAQDAYQLEFITRTQRALKQLGFYTMEIDGQTGPGTRAAVAAYQRAFELPSTFEDAELYDLEWRAADGWRSLAEIEEAHEGGFDTREGYLKAKAGGFTDVATFENALAAGFGDADTYAAFLRSGASNKASFEAQEKAVAAAEAAADACLENTRARQWGQAIEPCYEATRAMPGDAAAKLALDTVLENAADELDTEKALLAEKRSQLAALLGNQDASPQAVAAMRREVNDMADRLLFTELHLQAGACADLVAREQWADALPRCHAQLSVTHLAGEKRTQADELIADLKDNRDIAEEGAKLAKAELEAEANRLALADAKAAAAALLLEVDGFSKEGHQFDRGIDVARELVALRAATEGEDAALIARHVGALRALLGADDGYAQAQAAMIEARESAEQAAVLEARRQAELINAFMLDYIGQNVTSEHVGALLPLSETMSSALEDGNAERITTAQAQTRRDLEAMGLAEDLAQFAKTFAAETVSAEELETADAETASASKALKAASDEAASMIAAVDAFAKGGGRFAEPIEVARGLTRLKAALSEAELPGLQVARDELAELLAGDSAYSEDLARRSSTSDAALANAIALAQEELAGINAFLLDHIATHLTEDGIEKTVELQMNVEEALGETASTRTVRILEEISDEIAALDLNDDLDSFIEAKAARSEVAETETADNGLAVTMANAELLKGNKDDLIVLRNSAAPHLIYDLVGDLQVEGGIASTCWLHPAPDNLIALLMARRELGVLGVKTLDVEVCDEPMRSADLVVLRRGDFLALGPSEAQPIVAAFEDGRLKPMVQIDGEAAQKESGRLASEADALSVRIGNGTAEGYGLLQLTKATGGICPVVEDLAPHGRGLASNADTIAFFLEEPRLAPPASAEDAFVAAQRGQCAGIYASAEDLASLTEALDRAEVGYNVTPIWIETRDVEEEAVRLAELSAQQVQQFQANLALLAAKSADQRSALQRQQDDFRAEYEDRALAAQKDIADLVRSFVEEDDRKLGRMFPATAAHLREAVNNHWVITGTDNAIESYGTAVWRERDVEAVLVRFAINRENAILGLYAEDCLVLGYLVDQEFRIDRDPVETTCDDTAMLDDWTSGRGFSSDWNLVPVETADAEARP